MAAKRFAAPVTKRYPNLRFVIKLYKALGLLVLTGCLIPGFVILPMAFIDGFIGEGSLIGIGLIFAGFSLAGLYWAIAEGIELATDVEENTRRSAQLLTQTDQNAAPAGDAARSAAHLENVVRILEMTAVYQQQTNKRLEELSTEIEAMRSDLTTGVQTLTTVAESSKVVATILYRQGVNHG
jgi:uncharacterized membrane protein (DUF485 family)